MKTTQLINQVDAHIDALLPTLIDIRHDIHTHPELGYEETRTANSS